MYLYLNKILFTLNLIIVFYQDIIKKKLSSSQYVMSELLQDLDLKIRFSKFWLPHQS